MSTLEEQKNMALKLAELDAAVINYGNNTIIDSVRMQRNHETQNPLGDKAYQYLDFLNDNITLLQTLNTLKAIRSLPSILTPAMPPAETLIKASHTSMKAETIKLHRVLEKLMLLLIANPYSPTLAKDIRLLADTSRCVENFYKNPRDTKNLEQLLNTTQQVYKKTGLLWHHVKTVLTAVAGIACIVVGILGIAPSMGISIGLIALGVTVCASIGLPQFTQPPKKVKYTNELYKSLHSMFTKANKLITLERQQSKQAHLHQPAPGR